MRACVRASASAYLRPCFQHEPETPKATVPVVRGWTQRRGLTIPLVEYIDPGEKKKGRRPIMLSYVVMLLSWAAIMLPEGTMNAWQWLQSAMVTCDSMTRSARFSLSRYCHAMSCNATPRHATPRHARQPAIQLVLLSLMQEICLWEKATKK